MTARKPTPDILSEVLAGSPPPEIAPSMTAPSSSLPVHRTKPAHSPKPGTGNSTGWEYLVISCQDYHGWRPRFANGKELQNWSETPLLHEYINVLGDKGWELAGAACGKKMFGNADDYQVYFKRAIKNR